MNLPKEKIVEFLRFCIVGTVATALHYIIYFAIIKGFDVESKLWTNVAYTIGYVLSWFVNLYLTARFTFREKVTVKRGFGFAASHGINYLLHMLFLNVFLAVGLSDEIAPLFVFAIVIPINFLLVRFVFKSKTFQKQEE